MPVCVHCAYPTPHLYTTYKTKSNIRLTVCDQCSQFTDPLIEHPSIVLLLDLILLKPRVFLHLLYNRGTRPLDATKSEHPENTSIQRERALWTDLKWLIGVTIIAEISVRVATLLRDGKGGLEMDMAQIVRVGMLVLVELLAQHIVTLAMGLVILKRKAWFGEDSKAQLSDGRTRDFLPIIIPLTLLYTSILPLLLNLFLSIWSTPSTGSQPPLPTLITLENLPAALQEIANELMEVWANTDKIWAGTRLLGGMSSGFGLRVVLPTRPIETTALVLGGWAAAALVGRGLQALYDTLILH